MSKLFTNVVISNIQHDGQNAASFTIRTREGNSYLISNCHELIHPMYFPGPRVYWGGYETIGDDELHHQVKAFIYRYPDYDELMLCE